MHGAPPVIGRFAAPTAMTATRIAVLSDLEAFMLGKDFCRVQVAAAQMSGLPLVDELASEEPPLEDRR